MFGQTDKIDEMKEKLNSVSPTFCMAKWMHSTIYLYSGHTHSCYLPPPHKIPLKEVKKDAAALHNTSEKKKARKMMQIGIRPKECSICWEVEDLPGDQKSDRHYRSVDDWVMPFYEKVKKTKARHNINPSYLEAVWSNTCNFRCMYCSPSFSTEWMKEISHEGAYEMDGHHLHNNTEWLKKSGIWPLDCKDEDNPYLKAFWEWWPELVKDLMYFRLTGGEPLLSYNTFKVIDYLIDNPQPQLELSTNSNLGAPEKQINKFISLLKTALEKNCVKGHILHASLDTWGKQAEYIRWGLNLEQFQANVHKYLEELPTSSIAFMCTFNNLSLTNFIPYLQWILDLRKKFNNSERSVLLDLPHLQSPEFLSARILTPDFDGKMGEIVGFMEANMEGSCGFSQAEIDKFNRIRGWMRGVPKEKWLNKQRKNFYYFFREYDRRRGTDFCEIFPEMRDFYNLCKELVMNDPKKIPLPN